MTYIPAGANNSACTDKKQAETKKAPAPAAAPKKAVPSKKAAPAKEAMPPKNAFCAVGKKDQFGSCHCKPNQCEGPGCVNEFGMTYYAKDAKNTACTDKKQAETKKAPEKATPAPKKATPEPKKAVKFCAVGTKDEYGSCHCKPNQCKGPGCANEFGMTYYMEHDKD